MEEMNMEIVRSNRRTISIEIKPDLKVIVRAPLSMKEKDIKSFIEEKSPWLKNHYEKIKTRLQNENAVKPLTNEEIRELTFLAKNVLADKVKHYSELMNTEYGKITVRHQKTLWGSCSGKRNLNFNCLLMLCPEEVIDYVVVHELCHLKEMNHSPAFWAEVEKIMPDYRVRRQWLKENGNSIISRMER